MANINVKIRNSTQPVKVKTAFVGKNSLATASLEDLGNVQTVPQDTQEGSFLEYDTNSNSFRVNNVMDSGIF